MNLTTEQITSLAPDAASIKAGRGLVKPGKWPLLGQSGDILWGECQGSSSTPYQVSVDLGGPAFKCTCPSRKFPCKHGLGLLLLVAEQPAKAAMGDPPPWVTDWVSARREKAEKQATVAAKKKEGPLDTEAAARRTAKRWQRMTEGAEELARWLTDQVRHGLATYPQQPASVFAGVAARMVDAQLPGLANEIAQLESCIHSGEVWPQRVLGQLGRMALITEGLSRFATLPEPVQGDLRGLLGWVVDKDEVLASAPPVADEWCILGQVFTERDRLWVRRTWLLGRHSARLALLLDFMHGQRSFPVLLLPGTCFQGELAFYPSAWPLRALLLNPPAATQPLQEPFPGLPNFDAALEARAAALAANPWLLAYPFNIERVLPLCRNKSWWLRDGQGAELPLKMAEQDAWGLLAISGGHPLTVSGEWNDSELRVLGVWADGFHSLGGG